MTMPYFNPHKRRFNLAPKKAQSDPNLFYFRIVFRTKPDPKAQRALKNSKSSASDISPQG